MRHTNEPIYTIIRSSTTRSFTWPITQPKLSLWRRILRFIGRR